MTRHFPAKQTFELEATPLRAPLYAVRPKGWVQGVPWTVIYVNAGSPSEAIRKARKFRPN